MKLVWIRHFPIEGKGKYIGHTDVDAVLPEEKVTIVSDADILWFSSPLKRCLQTAKHLGATNPKTAPELMEQHFGAWEGQPYDCVQCDWANPAGMKPEGGESFEEVCVRVGAWLDKLLAAHKGREAIVIAHAGTIRAGLAHALNISPHQALAFRIEHACATEIEYFTSDETVACVSYVNKRLK